MNKNERTIDVCANLAQTIVKINSAHLDRSKLRRKLGYLCGTINMNAMTFLKEAKR